MNKVVQDNTFLTIQMTVAEADQAVYAIEQCHEALTRAVESKSLKISADTKTDAIKVLKAYAGAIMRLREELDANGTPADPSQPVESLIYHERIDDQPLWIRIRLMSVNRSQLEGKDGTIIAYGKQLGNTFYEYT